MLTLTEVELISKFLERVPVKGRQEVVAMNHLMNKLDNFLKPSVPEDPDEKVQQPD